ncbi:MAG: peptidase P60 [Alphaproteobacteria bacterium]|nr:peptidase P60 [Alphaproteobacteria bacterium]
MVARAEIIAEARAWRGTPYRHQASVKGIGADCLGLVRGVYRALYGEEPEPMPAYTEDWAEITGAETLADAAARHLVPIAIDEAQPGDVVLFRIVRGGPAKHAAILSEPARIVHAYSGHAVAESPLTPWWRRKIAYAFSFPALTG